MKNTITKDFLSSGARVGFSQTAAELIIMPGLLQLPDECLLAVLRCCADDNRSLFSAARAHSRLHQATVLAVSSINATVLEQEQARSILEYLSNHGQHVDSIDLKGEGDRLWETVRLRQLPHNNLQKLSSLKISRWRLQLQPRRKHQGVLWGGAPLTQLRLDNCLLLDKEPVGERLAAALSLLPDLQHLCFARIWRSDMRGLCFPSSVLQQLQQLTYLELARNQLQNTDDMQHLQALPRLQDLRLGGVTNSTIRASWLSNLQHLTQLKVRGHRFDFEPGALAGKTQLQHLDVQLQLHLSNGGSLWVEQLLSHVQSMQQLTHLNVSYRRLGVAPAAAYAALTASTKLQHLGMCLCQMPAAAWQHIFPAARQLPQLRVLDLYGLHNSWPFDNALAPEGSRLVSCCPGLQVLRMPYLLYTAELLAPLTGLSSLTELVLRPGDSPDRHTPEEEAQGLDMVCRLTGLRRLSLDDPQDDSGLLLQLTQLKQLTYLSFRVCGQQTGYKTARFSCEVSVNQIGSGCLVNAILEWRREHCWRSVCQHVPTGQQSNPLSRLL